MSPLPTSPRKILSIAGFILIVVLICGYGAFEARKIFMGPQLTITSPLQGSATSSTTVTLVGTAHNISFLTINDKPAFTDADGNFTLTLSPPPGYTVLTVAASDRFGRRATKSVAFTLLTYCKLT